PTATYQWYRNEAPILGATGPTLEIPNANVTDLGQYSVTVENANGSVRSDPSKVVMTGGFNIEAVDFNTGGQSLDVASQFPYLGGAYLGLPWVPGVDASDGPDQSGG